MKNTKYKERKQNRYYHESSKVRTKQYYEDKKEVSKIAQDLYKGLSDKEKKSTKKSIP